MPTSTTPTPSRFDELGALDPEGFWVRHHDHLAFVASGDVIRAALTAEVARLREALESLANADVRQRHNDVGDVYIGGVCVARPSPAQEQEPALAQAFAEGFIAARKIARRALRGEA